MQNELISNFNHLFVFWQQIVKNIKNLPNSLEIFSKNIRHLKSCNDRISKEQN